MLGTIFLLLAVRSLILGSIESKGKIAKAVDFTLAIISVIFFLLLPKDLQWKPILIIGAMIGVSIYRRLSQKKEERKFSYQSLINFTCLYAFGAAVVLASRFFQPVDNTIGRIILTGETRQEWISWKNPAQDQIESTWVTAHEVVIEDARGRELSREYVYGDLVGLRAELMTIKWPFQLLGFSNLCHLEMVHNGYSSAQRHNFFPHQGFQLPYAFKLFQTVWGKLFNGQWKIPGVKNGTLESLYFPLVTADLKPNQGSFVLSSSFETID